MKKVVKKYDKGGAKPKGVSKQVASVTGLPEGSYVAKSKAVTKPAVKTITKAPVKTPVKQPVKTAYDVLKDKQTAVKNPRVGTPVKGTVTTNPKKTVTVKKSTVKPAAVKAVEEQVTPLAFKKVSDFAPIKSTASSTTSSAPKSTVSKTTPDRVKAPVNKPTVSMGERLTGYKGTSKPVASTTTSAPTSTIPTPTESTSGKVSLMDRIKGNIAKRKMKKMVKLSEQVGQSRAMGSYAQPAMKKGGIAKKLVKAQYGIATNKNYPSGTPAIAKKYNPAKIKVTSSKKKPSYNEVFKTKKK
jgi:hypothetical protein